jgi:hypothetical protein
MEKIENTHFIDYVVEGMRKSAAELEEFQVQLSLGKMEAMDAFEDLKKSYNNFTHEVKLKAIHGKQNWEDILAKIQDLQVQLALGKAETSEAFEAQKKKIVLAIHSLQVAIKTNPAFIESNALFLETLENFKLKMEILSEKLKPLKEKVSTEFTARKEQLEDAILVFKENIRSKSTIDERFATFQDELSEAFSHFKKAFVSR